MPRTLWLFACVACALLALPAGASAEEMDLALSRLRLARNSSNCPSLTRGAYCADQELFERLISELAIAMTPPVVGPARTLGPRGFQLAFGTTVTSIEGGQLYWRRGTEGDRGSTQPDRSGRALGLNESPQAVLAWNHLQLRKGLPLGLEAVALLGQGMNTSMWTLGAALKWGVFEGFRTGLGQLPDVSLQAAVSRSVGSSQATLHLYAFDLTISKPFVVRQTWSVSPFTGLQFLRVEAESGVVDLTPGGPSLAGGPPAEDAFGSCRPLPGHQTQTDPPATVACARDGEGADFANDVMFGPVRHSRVRMFLGGQTRYRMFTFAASLMFDLSVPKLDAPMDLRHIESESVARQLGFTVSVGAVL